MCTKTLWHPTGPCCSESSHCGKFPKIDFAKVRWIVRVPSAVTAHELFAYNWFDGGRREYPKPGTDYWAYSGVMESNTTAGPPAADVVVFPEVFVSSSATWICGGQYIGNHSGQCQWSVRCKEELCPGTVALCAVYNQNWNPQIWYPPAADILGVNGAPAPDAADYGRFDAAGVLTRYTGLVNPGYFVSWKRILQAAECTWLPQWNAAGWEFGEAEVGTIQGGLKRRLREAETILHGTQTVQTSVLNPTAIDLATDFTLTGGLNFGIQTDPRSPFYGQFVIYSGSTFESVGDPPSGPTLTPQWWAWANDRVMTSTPWHLVSGSEVSAELGVTNRWERTDDNTTLPDWIELTLVRI